MRSKRTEIKRAGHDLVVAGIDYSITSPALCVCRGAKFDYNNCTFYALCDAKVDPWGNVQVETHKPYKNDTERFDHISQWAADILEDATFISIEGYAMGAKGKVFNLAENCGLLKYKLWKGNKPFMIIPPTTAKKAATGKGNADKQVMYDAWKAETGINLKEILQPNRKLGNPTTDIVDAFFLCKLAHAEFLKAHSS